MKKFFLITLFFGFYLSVFSQQDSANMKTIKDIEIENLKQKLIIANEVKESLFKDFQDRIKSKDNVIDSLNRVSNKYLALNANILKIFQDSTKKIIRINEKLTDELSDIVKFKENKKITESHIKLLNDSIFKLITIIIEKDKQKLKTDSVNKKKFIEEFNKGKQIVLDSILYSYRGKTFDTIIYSTTILSVKRDKQLIGDNAEVKQLFADLIVFFETKDLLETKFDALKIKNAQSQLYQIKRESVYISKLKEKLDNYQSFSNGLKDCLIKIIELDKKELVAGQKDDIKKLKFNKILSPISAYIFNYDFNFNDYPYLSDIVLELIKLKTPDPDANISGLLDKL